MPSFEIVESFCKEHNQPQLLRFYPELAPKEQQELLETVNSLDLKRINEIFQTSTTTKLEQNLSPLTDLQFDSTIGNEGNVLKWESQGLKAISQSKVCRHLTIQVFL